MKRITYCLVFALLACTALLQAQNNNSYWEKVEGPPGGIPYEIVPVQGQSTIYGRINNYKSHLYRTTDNGLNWTPIDVLFYGSNSNGEISIGQTGTFYFSRDTFLAGNSQTLFYRSEDEGQSWTLVTNSGPYSIKRIRETETGVLFGTYYNNSFTIHRSTDGGQTWALGYTVPASSLIKKVSFYGNGRLILHREAAQQVFSDDDGQNWHLSSLVTQDSKTWFTPSGAILGHFVGADGSLLRSTDLGQTWDTLPANTLPFNNKQITSLVGLPSGRILAKYPVTNDTITAVSDDDGLTWQLQSHAFSFDGFLLARPLSNGQLLATWQNQMRSVDPALGASVLASNGFDAGNLNNFEAYNDSIFFAASQYNLYRKTGNNPWELILEGCNNFRLGNTQTIIATNNNNTKAFLSTDLGNTFQPLVINGPSDDDFLYPPFFSPGDSLIFAGQTNGIFRSRDAGQTWQLVMSGNFFDISNMAFLPSGRYVLTANSTFLYSDDFGLSWNIYPDQPTPAFPIRPNQLVSDASGRLYHANTTAEFIGILLVSTDEGDTWSHVKTYDGSLSYYFGCAVNSLGHVFIQDDAGPLLFSPNGALNWQTLPGIFEPWLLSVDQMNFSPSGRAYVLSSGKSGIFRTTSSTTAGGYVSGMVQRDGDGDCSTNDVQPAQLDHWVVEAQGENTYFTTTDSLGRYTMFVDTGSYTVKTQTPQYLWWSLCQPEQAAEVPFQLAVDTVDFVTLALSDCPLISVELGTPFLRRCFNNDISVLYCNQGTETADSAWIDVSLDPYLSFIQSGQPHLDLGNNNVRFFVGDVPSGNCGQFKFTVYINCDSTVLGQTHCITAHGFPDTLCTPVPNWSGADIRASAVCQADTLVEFKLQNVGGANSAVLDYIIIEDDVVMYQGSQQYDPGEIFSLPVEANGHTYRIESEQEPGHPFSNLALAFQEGCGGFESLGFINQFSVNGFTPSLYTLCEENTGSYDPNDKHGYPIGVGEDHRILPGQSIEYRIRFQNTGTDTAFTVVLRDTLSGFLDPASVRPGASSHAYTWQLESPGVLVVTFANILLPDSTTNLEGSQGYIRFKIDQQPDLPLNTRILNTAAIYFDFNPAVMTNETWHTVGFPESVDAEEPWGAALNHLVAVSPNPAEEQVNFRMEGNDTGTCQVQLYNPLGIAVGRYTFEGTQLTIPRQQLPAGAYRWVLTSQDGVVADQGTLIFK